jgi:predicted RNase H-like HicB family nuclease
LADYIALIHKDAESDYSVSFPDFPGCVTAGSSIDEARALAAEALAFHIEGMREDGQGLPAPSPLAEVMKERANRDAVAFLVGVPDQAERNVRVNVMLPKGLLRQIDARTENRSRFLADAAAAALQGPPPKARRVAPVAGKAPARARKSPRKETRVDRG